MSDEKFAKKIYNDLINFHHQWFNTWASGVMEFLNDLKLDITMNTKSFALNCMHAVQNKFVAVFYLYVLMRCLKVILLLGHDYIL